MAKIWSTTVPNTFSNELGNIRIGSPDADSFEPDKSESSHVVEINEKEREKLELEISNREYKEFWNKLKSYAPEPRVVKKVPNLTFSWEGVNAFCEKKRSIWKSCWTKVTKQSSKEAAQDRDVMIGKWDPTRTNDAYLQFNEGKVTPISYRSSNNSSNNSSTSEDQSIESFSSSSSSIGSKPNFFQVLNNGDFEARFSYSVKICSNLRNFSQWIFESR